MQTRLLIAALLAEQTSSIPHGTAGGCAVQLDKTQSNVWTDSLSKTHHFSLRVKVLGHWPPFAHIKLEWPEAVEIQHVYEAEACSKGCANIISVPDDSAQSLTAQLGPEKHESMSIALQGTGSLEDPTVTCLTEAEWAKAPPPAPPHADDCDLKPKYNVVNSWDQGEMVEIDFGAWDAMQLVRDVLDDSTYRNNGDTSSSDVIAPVPSVERIGTGSVGERGVRGRGALVGSTASAPEAEAPDI